MSFQDAFNAAPAGAGRTSGLTAFDSTPAAPEYVPLPAGIYAARIVSGAVNQTKKGDDAYRMVFEVSEGEQRGRRVSRTWTFSEKAIGYAKRDLAAFGLANSQALLSPFPPVGREIYCRLVVALQRGDDGREFNDIKKIDVLRSVDSPAAPFLIGDDPPAAEPQPPSNLFSAPPTAGRAERL